MMASPLQRPAHRLSYLLEGLAEVPSNQDPSIEGLALDSRKVARGGLFLACAGTRQHGLAYAETALGQGAVAIAWEPDGLQAESLAAVLNTTSVPLLPVPGLTAQVSHVAARFFAHPARSMRLVGITGTNGKTSVCQLLAQAISSEQPCAMIGTLGAGLPGNLSATGMTTPDAITVQALLADFLSHGVQAVAMEVSSHALDQHRVAGIEFETAVFTNLSRDHFDYHGSLEHYAQAKARLFQMPGLGGAVVNLDDPFGRVLIDSLASGVRRVGYSLQPGGVSQHGLDHWVYAESVDTLPDGLAIQVVAPEGKALLRSRLLGRFNAANLLATVAVLMQRGWSLQKAVQVLAGLPTVPGRMALLGGGDRPSVVVDYAHTPDALEKALLAARAHCPGRLHVVFGCGGDRDPGKRPIMGELGARLADVCCLTDDNPRTEPSARILAQILSGIDQPQAVRVEADRRRAIFRTIAEARPGDLVLVAGKGHEDYQLVGDQVLHFDDHEVVEEALDAWWEVSDA
ncbi:MAG: UDP-N-acetylmuramoyl-L-alanyl-D-glutamate--2,6-diaminopimelate ligase [Candidatus Thiodiazotropha sp.]